MDRYANFEFQELGRNSGLGNASLINPVFERPMSAQARLGAYDNSANVISTDGRYGGYMSYESRDQAYRQNANYRISPQDKKRPVVVGQTLRDKNSRSPGIRSSSPTPDKSFEGRSALLEEFRNSKTKNFELKVIFL